jgi:hypothetical protein
MKKRLSYILAVALFASIVSPAMAGPVIVFDENGNGFIDGVASPGFISTDPISGINTLTYNFGGVSGDVLVTEPNQPNAADSDLLRWIGGALYVFSDVESGEPPGLADVGIPTQLQTNMLMATETGLFGNPYAEGLNGIVYTPLAGQPGDMGNGVTYIFVSDGSIPEPASMVVLGSGIAIVALFSVLRRRLSCRRTNAC